MSRNKELIKIWNENIELWKVHLEEISTQPKQDNTQYLLDQVSRLTAENAMLKEKAFSRPELSTNSLQLDEPELEPVAWMYEEATSFNKDGYFSEWLPCFYLEKADEDKSLRNETPLYASPPKREAMSTKQAEDLWETSNFKTAVPYYIFDEICVAIEQYHKIGVDNGTH
jgi:hypothetical protein